MTLKHYFSMQHILALVSLLYAATCFIWSHFQEDVFVFISLVGASVLGVCAIVVLLKKEPDVYTAAGIIGIGFGTHMIFSFVIYLDGEDMLRFVFGAVGVVAGLLTMMFSIPLYCGNKYDTKRILIVLGVYLAAYVIPMVVWVAFLGFNFYELIKEYLLYILFFIPVVIFIVMLYKTDIGYRGTGSRSNTNIRMLTDALYSDQNTYAWRSDFKKIADEHFMKEVEGHGHVRAESKLPLIMGGKDSYLIVQKWDNGKQYGMIARYDDGTMIQTLRFELCDIVPEGDLDTADSFTIYGREGFFIRILVKDEEVKRNNGRLRKFLTMVVGANSKY